VIIGNKNRKLKGTETGKRRQRGSGKGAVTGTGAGP